MRVLVTGGAGFIGSHVVDELVNIGHEVVVVDSLHPSVHPMRPSYLNKQAEYIIADVRDQTAVEAAAKDCAGVVHLAAKVGLETNVFDLKDYVDHNDLGTASVLSALTSLGFDGTLVVASSMVVYGDGRYRCLEHGITMPSPRTREDLDAGYFEPRCTLCGAGLLAEVIGEDAPLLPNNIYAATKLHQEQLCMLWARATTSICVPLRYHNVYGPRMPRDTPYAGVASRFASRLAEGLAPLVFEDGQQQRDFVHVLDVAHATVLALLNGTDSTGALNIASGRPCAIGDVATALREAWGNNAPSPQVTGEYREGDIRHIVASPQRAFDQLGFEAQVELSDGVRDVIDGLRPSVRME